MKKNLHYIVNVFILTIMGIFLMPNTFANNSTWYLIGENDNIIFNLDEKFLQKNAQKYNELQWNETQNAILWDFYIKWIGFVNVKGLKTSCNHQTNICNTSGNVFAESAGNVFANIYINKNTKKITGTFSIPNTGQFLAVGGGNFQITKNSINIKESTVVANHNAELSLDQSIANAHLTLEISWQSVKYPISDDKKTFKNVDLSLAWTYKAKLSANGREYDDFYISVTAGAGTSVLKGGDFFAKSFCNNNESNALLCPDGKERKASRIEWFPFVANGSEHTIAIKWRDAYGNKINGNTRITFSNNTPPAITTSIDTNSQINNTLLENGFKIRAFTPWSLKIQTIELNNTEIKSLEWEYTISPPYQTSISMDDTIYANKNHHITVERSEMTTNSITGAEPYVYITMSIPWGEVSINTPNEEKYCIQSALWSFHKGDTICDISGVGTAQIIVPLSQKNHITFSPRTWNQEGTLNIKYGIKYKLDNTWYAYELQKIEKNIQKNDPKPVSIIGENIDTFNIQNNNKSRIHLLNEIRKNIEYLKRNGGGNTEKYEISSSVDKHLDSSHKKDSYIIIGKDFYINEDITNIKAIIALSDANGNGGNIYINENVKNINVTLIAENNILATPNLSPSKDNQLYIFGSISAKNLSEDSFIKMRENFDDSDLSKKSEKWKIHNNPDKIIIEYNPSLRISPPPGLENFVE